MNRQFKKTDLGQYGAYRIFVLACLFSIVFWFIPGDFSFAQSYPFSIEKLSDVGTNRDFVVGPGKSEVVLNPGEQRVVNLKVTNRLGETKVFYIKVEDFVASSNPNEAVTLLGDQRGPYSLKDYLHIPAYEFTLEHGDKATIPVTISIPSDEEPGGRYGSVVIGTVTREGEKGLNSAGSPIISQIGTLFFVRIPGDTEEAGLLKQFRAKTGKTFFGEGPIDFEILYENSGSVHLNPYGEIRIKNIFGKEVGNIIVHPWFTLPNSLRIREISWNRDFLMGLYTADISLNRGYEDIIDKDSFTFFVLPWRLILGLLVIVISVLSIIKAILSKFEIRMKDK